MKPTKDQLGEPAAPSVTNSGLDVLIASAAWTRCTRQQRLFLTHYLTNGLDAKHAIAAAYPKANTHSRTVMQSQVLRSPAVVEALEFWKWRDSREALISIIKQQLKAAPEGSIAAKDFTIQLERLLIGIQGTNKAHFKDPDEPDEPESPETNIADKRIPEGAQVWYDNATGAAIGYRFDGKDIQL